jgi:hypothetical protein
MRRQSTLTAILALCVALLPAAAFAQANSQPDIPRGGGMFPDVPRGDQNNPKGSVPPENPTTPTLPGHGHGGPIIVVTPDWQRRGAAAGDQRVQAVQRALGGPAGLTVNWISGTSSGQITPVGDRIVSGMNCRDLRQSTTTLGRTEEGTSTYCLTSDGEWVVVGP